MKLVKCTVKRLVLYDTRQVAPIMIYNMFVRSMDIYFVFVPNSDAYVGTI